MNLAVLITTYNQDKKLLRNLFSSLRDLRPYEICISDTSKDYDPNFEEWLYSKIGSCGATIGKVRHIKDSWQDNQVKIKNDLIELSESDWFLMLDSDEMITIEMAQNLKLKLESLPSHIKCLRVKKINLIDDTHCLSNDVWKGRPPIGHHPQIFKKGAKFLGHPRYDNKRHPILSYEGRDSIDYNSSNHPCQDWEGYYMVHLWLYKNMASNWQNEKWQRKEKDDKVKRGTSLSYIKQRGWEVIKIPKIATWRKINL